MNATTRHIIDTYWNGSKQAPGVEVTESNRLVATAEGLESQIAAAPARHATIYFLEAATQLRPIICDKEKG